MISGRLCLGENKFKSQQGGSMRSRDQHKVDKLESNLGGQFFIPCGLLIIKTVWIIDCGSGGDSTPDLGVMNPIALNSLT
jgi:hypothetical protein